MMKKVFFLSLFVLLSCSRDDNSPETFSIVGTWKITKGEVRDLSTNQITSSTPSGCQSQDTHEFQTNKVISTHYHLSNNNCIGDEIVIINYTLDLKNNKFWYEGEEKYPYLISKLASNELILIDKYGDSNDDGIVDNYKTLYFTRVR